MTSVTDRGRMDLEAPGRRQSAGACVSCNELAALLKPIDDGGREIALDLAAHVHPDVSDRKGAYRIIVRPHIVLERH